MRSGISPAAIVDQLRGIRCPSTVRRSDVKCTSCPDAIARAIEQVARQQQFDGYRAVATAAAKLGERKQEEEAVASRMHFCPECGEKLEHEGGCVSCRNCGYSKCG